MLNYILEVVSRFCALNFFKASPFEYFKFLIMKILMMTLVRRSTTVKEAVNAMNSSVAIKKRKNYSAAEKRKGSSLRTGQSSILSKSRPQLWNL